MLWKLLVPVGISYISESNRNDEKRPVIYPETESPYSGHEMLRDFYGISCATVCQNTRIFIVKDFLKHYQPDKRMLQELYDDQERILKVGES